MPNPSSWQFTATLYGWATGLNGSVGVGRLPPAKVDMSFVDIADHLTGAFMGALTARNDTFLFGIDLIWSRLQDNVGFKVGFAEAKFQQTLAVGSAFAGYRIPVGSPDFALYGTIGVRAQRLSVKVNTIRVDPRFDRYGSASDNWVDPVVGLAAHYSINPKWYVDALADIGGFDVGSKLTSQGIIAVGYNWTPSISTAIGYRALYTDYQKNNDGGGSFRYDTTMHGPFATLSVHF